MIEPPDPSSAGSRLPGVSIDHEHELRVLLQERSGDFRRYRSLERTVDDLALAGARDEQHHPPSREQLLAEVALDVQAMAQQHQHPLKGYKPEAGAASGGQVLDELRAVQSLVAATATSEETAAFAGWLIACAQAAADAAKEGGFMGFGAEQVSEGEQAMLDQLSDALST